MDLRGQRGTAWSVTCNLKEVTRARVDECIAAAGAAGWGVEGQLERGAKEGTQHYQLMVRTPQVRASAVKKMFPTAHIELARNVAALRAYVHKEETREESLKKIEVTFLTYAQVRNQFFTWLLDTYPGSQGASHDQRLEYWDRFIGLSIEAGMECDLIGMNPQNRACVAKYWRSYIARECSSRQTEERRQPDRQTEEEFIPRLSIPIYAPEDSC